MITCDPTEVALKSFFLGPQGENAPWLMEELSHVVQRWVRWRQSFRPQDGAAISGQDQRQPEFLTRQGKFGLLLEELCRRLEDELPKFSPRYVGHMFSELSLPGLMGHLVTLLHNPNLISRESARVAAGLEDEALQALAEMVGLERAWGHFSSGGTLANFEAVVRAQARSRAWMTLGARHHMTAFQAAHMGWERYAELRQGNPAATPEASDPYQAWARLEAAFGRPLPGPALLLPRSAHYSWKKAASVFGANLRFIEQDAGGRYRIDDLVAQLRHCREIGQAVLAVVSVAGTTELGSVDPIERIQDVLDGLTGAHVWHHVDAAYGGFFCSLLREPPGEPGRHGPLEPQVMQDLRAISRCNSVTLDPHKLGYVPYSCGTFLAADERDYTCVQTLAPYVDYRESGDRGPYTLEGSRSAGGAVATWLTARSIGLHQGGYGLLLARTVRQKQKLQSLLEARIPAARVYPGCDTNLLCFCLVVQGEPVSRSNERALRILHYLRDENRYFFSKTHFGPEQAGPFVTDWQGGWDCEQLLVLRLCLMNPFFDSAELEVNHIDSLLSSLTDLLAAHDIRSA